MKKSMCENEMYFRMSKEDELEFVEALQEALQGVFRVETKEEECDMDELIGEAIDEAIDYTLDEVNELLAKHEIPLLFDRCNHCDEFLLYEIEE